MFKKLTLASLVLAGASANAAQDTGNMNVLVRVIQTCAISSIEDVVFDAIDGTFQSNTDTDTGLINVRCTSQVPYSLGIGDGENASAGNRRMADPGNANFIRYQLHRDSNRANAWGAIGSGNAQSGTGSGLNQPYTVYARIPSGQTPVPGALYDDVVEVVLDF